MRNLIELLDIEFYKVKHHKLSKILIIAYFALLSSIALIASIKFKLGNTEIHLAEQGIFNFPYIWHFNTYIADIFTFFLAIIIVSMVTNEYSYRTLKQNLIDGLSKQEFILSKFALGLGLSAFATLFVFVISLILGLIYSDFNSPGIIFWQIYFLPAFFLKLTGVFSFILFLGILFKRSAFALGFFFVWMVIEKIFYGLFRWKFFNDEIATKLIAFFPYTSFQNLLPQPFTRLNAAKQLGHQIGQDIDKFQGLHPIDFLIVVFWILFFYYSSLKLLKSRDL